MVKIYDGTIDPEEYERQRAESARQKAEIDGEIAMFHQRKSQTTWSESLRITHHYYEQRAEWFSAETQPDKLVKEYQRLYELHHSLLSMSLDKEMQPEEHNALLDACIPISRRLDTIRTLLWIQEDYQVKAQRNKHPENS